ncbi:MAG: hypothetical protein K2L02_03255 [Clostridia bacterium]|nr:hypothetical protein [Clostridia bacterium]
MKKSVKTAGIVALSAVLACGALGALAGCKGGSGGTGKPLGAANELTVSIFCNSADATTNQKICNQWAAEYNQKNGTSIKVTLANNTDKSDYFKQLDKEWSTDATADIIYLSPKYVRAYVENGNILDLTDYLNADEFKNADGTPKTSGVWQNGISYYGYIKGKKSDYIMGQPIKEKDGKYVTDDGTDTQVGLYGLPKDYSNFSTGYNRKFFSEERKIAYTTTKPTQGGTTAMGIKGPTGDGTGSSELTSKCTYDHLAAFDNCITYAGTGTYTAYNPYTKQEYTVTGGQPANIINVGVPTTYKPYNFFRWNSFNEALNGGDPVAAMSEAFGGYTVTIPGFPNDEMKIEQADFDAVYNNPATLAGMDVPYNNKIGHVTYTYAEYGALLWACTYYLNTFAWDKDNEGYGGVTSVTEDTNGNTVTKHVTVYGGEQYEGVSAAAVGSVLYLLPWLASNDADLINNYSTLTAQNGISANPAITDPTKWKEAAGTATYEATKMTLANKTVKKNIQYGHNSQNFIETYAAFLAIGSDWNANPSGDITEESRPNSGWDYFRTGRALCYGAGSWDAATRNDVNQSVLEFGQMPTPIAEKYALYSEIKDANYQHQKYSNDPAKAEAGSQDEGKQRATLSTGLKGYLTSENDKSILYNQIRRQDKWAARMDTVGFAVAAKVANYPEEHAWKEQAAVSLAARLSINEEAQVSLLYGGAQLPNFVSQCKEFVNYKDTQYRENGSFKDMLTPEGFADTEDAAEGAQIWAAYYAIAAEMETLAQSGSSQTVGEFLATKDYKGAAIRHDTEYDSTRFSEFTGEGVARIAYAMKVLRMVSYRADDRDINIRMQYGLNAVRDSSMYTYKDDWMTLIDSRLNTRQMLAYNIKKPLDLTMAMFLFETDGTSTYIQMNPAQANNPSGDAWNFYTPAVWCFAKAPSAQTELWNAITEEINAMAGNT